MDGLACLAELALLSLPPPCTAAPQYTCEVMERKYGNLSS
jgi:hypothetical protein